MASHGPRSEGSASRRLTSSVNAASRNGLEAAERCDRVLEGGLTQQVATGTMPLCTSSGRQGINSVNTYG